MYSKQKKKAFTLVELLTVLAIVTMLLGLLVPALNTIRKFAKETKQKAQFAAIDVALTAYRNDFGDYPPSHSYNQDQIVYSGSQCLSIALLGYDLKGYDPMTPWNNPSEDIEAFYNTQESLNRRKDRYLELATTNAYHLGVTDNHDGILKEYESNMDPDSYVLCDVFSKIRITLPDRKTEKAGMPILYYKANPAGQVITSIYDYMDNLNLVLEVTGELQLPEDNPLIEEVSFAEQISDPKVDNYPYRPDSYILISAGADGRYGTADDIHNFGN